MYCDEQSRMMCLNDQGGGRMDVTFDVTGTLRAQMGGHPPAVLVYDARGNGGGAICPTITGDHESRITDYTAVVVSVDEENLYREPLRRLSDDGAKQQP